MDFGDMIELLLAQTDGIVSVFIILGIVIFYILVDKKILFQSKKTDEKIDNGFKVMSEKMSEQNQKLIDCIIENNKTIESHNAAKFDKVADVFQTIMKTRDEKKDEIHTEKLNYRLEISKTINDQIYDLMNYSHADRVEIIEFHNSKENLNQLSFLWYDVQYQQIDSYNVKPVDIRSHPINLLTPIISDVVESENNLVIYDKSKMDAFINISVVLKYHIEQELGIKEFVASGIFDNDNHLIGILTLDYISKPLDRNIIDLQYIHDTTVGISNLLKFDDKN